MANCLECDSGDNCSNCDGENRVDGTCECLPNHELGGNGNNNCIPKTSCN